MKRFIDLTWRTLLAIVCLLGLAGMFAAGAWGIWRWFRLVWFGEPL